MSASGVKDSGGDTVCTSSETEPPMKELGRSLRWKAMAGRFSETATCKQIRLIDD